MTFDDACAPSSVQSAVTTCFLWKSPGNSPGKIPPVARCSYCASSIRAGIVLPTDQSDCSMPPSHVITGIIAWQWTNQIA